MHLKKRKRIFSRKDKNFVAWKKIFHREASDTNGECEKKRIEDTSPWIFIVGVESRHTHTYIYSVCLQIIFGGRQRDIWPRYLFSQSYVDRCCSKYIKLTYTVSDSLHWVPLGTLKYIYVPIINSISIPEDAYNTWTNNGDPRWQAKFYF